MRQVYNGYAGLGGNRKLWQGVEVTAVESNEKIASVYQSLNPNDKVIIGDAQEYFLNHHQDFDFAWFSPPCQKNSKMVKATRHDVRAYPDLRIYELVIFLEHFFKGNWVVENVEPYYEPLIRPTAKIGRHYFWSNFEIGHFHIEQPKGFINKATTSGAQELKDWLGIQYEGNIYYDGNHCPAQVLRNCVHPDLGLHIFKESKRVGLFTYED